MNKSIDIEGGFISTFSKIADTILLCILWLICCIPVVTVGVASGALYYAYHKAIRQDGGHPFRAFFTALKSNFLQATGIWLVLFIYTVVSLAACFLLRAVRDSVPLTGVFLALGVAVVGFVMMWGLVLFPYQARFKNTTAAVLKNSAILTIANLPWSILLLLLFAVAVGVTLFKPALCLPVAAMDLWLSNIILERIFRKVMTEEERLQEVETDEMKHRQ